MQMDIFDALDSEDSHRLALLYDAHMEAAQRCGEKGDVGGREYHISRAMRARVVRSVQLGSGEEV